MPHRHKNILHREKQSVNPYRTGLTDCFSHCLRLLRRALRFMFTYA